MTTRLSAALLTLALTACTANDQLPFAAGGTPTTKTATKTVPFTIGKTVSHGRIEDHDGLRVIRLWGTPEQRGRAHGELAGAEAIDLMRRELVVRFTRQKQQLARARQLLPVIVKYPKHYEEEILAMFAAIEEQGIDVALPGFARKIDVNDALLVNAMDLVVQIGCSGFTVFGDQVEGGGVLTARNFDWPVTGPYLIENCCLIVQHPEDGAAFASVAWPGYIGAVTGVNEHGVAVFLHYGDSSGGMPRAGCYPTATAARGILRQATATNAFAVGEELLKKTWPPRGYLTRVVGPDPSSGHPMRVFEADGRGVTYRDDHDVCIVTNHFLSRDQNHGSADSGSRMQDMELALRDNLSSGDRKLSVAEAWAALARVERSGRRFATLHSLMFRKDPWVFELALGKVTEDGRVAAAPGHGTRYRLSRDALFASIR